MSHSGVIGISANYNRGCVGFRRRRGREKEEGRGKREEGRGKIEAGR
jgi:hypothetical protein